MSASHSLVQTVEPKAFLATRDKNNLTVHCIAGDGPGEGLPEGVQVKRHAFADLAKAGTLEDLSAMFGRQEIAYDPTRIVSRIRGIVRLANEFRLAARRSIRQIAFEPRSRTVYVVLAERASRDSNKVGRLMLDLAVAGRKWQRSGVDCNLSVRVCTQVPPASLLVLVDRLSRPRSVYRRVVSGWPRLMAALSLSTAVATPVAAQAVKSANVTANTGVTVSSGVKGDLGAAIAAPITDTIGAQLDIGAGTDGYLGAGGQLFLRDSELGLVGLTSSIETLDDKVLYRLGAKTEFYLSSVTLGGGAGWQGGDGKGGAFGALDLSFYATPDFVLRGSADLSPDLQLYRVGAEWRPGFDALPGLSLYSDFEHGSEGDDAARVGLIYHFGEDGVSLMERDRKWKTQSTIFNRRALKYVS